MNRVLKFRAWDKQQKCFVDFDNPKNGVQYQCRNFRVSSGWDSYKEPVYDEDTADKFIIEQFTGLLDRNDKEIYEGDIVLDYYDGDDAFVVEWDKDIASFRLTGTDNIASVSFDNFYSDKDLEVIGNVHENKELWDE